MKRLVLLSIMLLIVLFIIAEPLVAKEISLLLNQPR